MLNKIIFYIGIGLFVVGLSILFFKKKPIDSVELGNALVVGTNSYPPYAFIDDNGKWCGFDIDVAKHVFKKLGKKLVIKNMSFDSLILSLKQAKIDVLIAAMSITPERIREIAMIHYHGEPLTSLSLIFWKEIPVGVKSIKDISKIKNKVVAVQAGQIQVQFLDQFKDVIEVRGLEEISDIIMDIKYGKSVAGILEHAVALEVKKKYSDIQILQIPVGDEFKSFGYGIGVARQNDELSAKVSKIVDEMKKNGLLKKLEAKWLIGGDNV